MSLKKTILICFTLITLCLIFIIFSIFKAHPIITKPYHIVPVVLYGIDVDNQGIFARYGDIRYGVLHEHNNVYLLGVFQYGNNITGTEITHKINAPELISLLSTINIRRRLRLNTGFNTNEWKWSVFLHQNNYIHIMIFDDEINVVITSGSGNRHYHLINSESLRSYLSNIN